MWAERPPAARVWGCVFTTPTVVIQLLSHVQPFLIPLCCLTAARQAPLSSDVSQSLLKFMSIESTESVMLSNHLILCHPLLLLPLVFTSIRSFPVSQLFASGGQSIGAWASASVLPMNIQGWFPLGLTGLILQSKGFSRVFSSSTVWKHQFFGTQLYQCYSKNELHQNLLEGVVNLISWSNLRFSFRGCRMGPRNLNFLMIPPEDSNAQSSSIIFWLDLLSVIL